MLKKLGLGFLLSCFCVFLLSRCVPMEDPAKEVVAPKEYMPLSWEAKDDSRKAWSAHIYKEVEARYESFSKAKDMTTFCPLYDSLDKDRKIAAISQMLVGVAFHESGWKPTSWMTETTMGDDCITKKQIRSEGLLQLSYCDTTWAKHCKFDWSKDKSLRENDPKKTIYDPYLNLSCGIGILANQVDKYSKITMEKSVYWAVLKIGGKYSKIPQIAESTKKQLPFCK
jgi:hypothetical protein